MVSLHVPSQTLTGSLVIVQLSSNLKAAIFSLSKSILNTGLWEKSFPTLLTMGDFFFLPSCLKFASGPNLCLVGMICYPLLSQRTASQHLDLNEKAVHLSWQSKHHSLLPPKTASPALCHSACKAKGQSGNTYCYSACYFPLCKDVSSYTHRGAYNCQKRN